MERAELIPLVSTVLATAHGMGDSVIITICEELGRRLVAEESGAPPQCPVCAKRHTAKMATQKRWRQRKREGKNATVNGA